VDRGSLGWEEGKGNGNKQQTDSSGMTIRKSKGQKKTKSKTAHSKFIRYAAENMTNKKAKRARV